VWPSRPGDCGRRVRACGDGEETVPNETTGQAETGEPQHAGERASILCVDPRRELFRQIERVLGRERFVTELETEIQRVVDRFEEATYDILFVSSNAAHGRLENAIDLLEVISAQCPTTQILFAVEAHHIRMAFSALRAGSYQYAKLPIDDEELELLIQASLTLKPPGRTNRLLREDKQPTSFHDMVGAAPAMQEVYRQIRQAAATDVPVLLTGETGTGKDLAAEAIHRLSSRSSGHYVPVHLGALPSSLVSSELFGHEAGAFTGAEKRYEGSFERAHGGTVFLDEISTMPDTMQVSLLRLLETHRFTRLGGSDEVFADMRVIAASNEDLGEAVREKRFREDLLFRLDVLHLSMPPLRERKPDLPLLVDHFLERYNREFNKSILGISGECMARLDSYSWPGNVRELKNVIQRAALMCGEDVLKPEHLPRSLQESAREPTQVSFALGTSLEEVEREMVIQTLRHCDNNRSRAASMLGICRRALYNKMKRYGIQPGSKTRVG
jgi:DNA-binding NtrC family response regulator